MFARLANPKTASRSLSAKEISHPWVIHSAIIFLGVQLTVWFLGIGDASTHLGLMPLWIVPVAWACLDKERFLNASESILKLSGRIDRISPTLYYSVLLAIFAIGWSLYYLSKYYSQSFSSYDLGIYSSIAHNSSVGHFFYSSVQSMNHLGEHFSPVMILFAPFYAITSNPFWLLLVLLISYLSVPVLFYFIINQLHVFPKGNRTAVYLLSLLWFLYRPMAAAISFPFHPSTIAGPLIVCAYYLQSVKKWWSFHLILLGLLFFKENLSLVWISFGLYFLFDVKQRFRGYALLAMGTMSAFLIINVIIPHYRGAEWTEHLSRVAPMEDLGLKARYFFRLMLPVFLIPLMRFRLFLLVLPPIALNLATTYIPQCTVSFHYDDITSPLIFVAVIEFFRSGGGERLRPIARKPATAFPALVFWMAFLLVELPLSPINRAQREMPSENSFELYREILDVRENVLTPEHFLYVQSYLDIYFQRYRKAALSDFDPQNAPPKTVILLSRHVSPWPFDTLDSIVRDIERSGLFKKNKRYRSLLLFEEVSGTEPECRPN
jgi:uncharacterized membrane protein